MSEAPIKLSNHFSSDEFACTCCGVFHIDMRLIKALEELRAIVKKPLCILSGYRCEKHNKAIGGAQASEHVKGLAADVAIPAGHTLKLFYERIEQVAAFKNGGVGLYPKERFAHVDVRGKRARWGRLDGKYVSISEVT